MNKKVIELNNEISCVVLNEEDFEGQHYLLVTVLDDNDELTDESAFLLEMVKDGETYYKKVSDSLLTTKLVALFANHIE